MGPISLVMTVLTRHAISADDSKQERYAQVSAPNWLTPDASALASRRGLGWACMSLAILVVALALVLLPGRAQIAPLVESDYCYLLMAADRMFDGLGPTAPLPVAPFQPWSWRADWALLTRWPIGYPILIASVRWLFDLSTIAACRWISLVACAAALVGWNVAMMTVGALAQVEQLLYVYIALAGNAPIVFRQRAALAAPSPVRQRTPFARRHRLRPT